MGYMKGSQTLPEGVKDKDKDIVIVKDKAKVKRFVKPTLDDIFDYCSERQNNVDYQKFYDYYSSNGWKVGKNPMKDWKAAVRTWEKNEAPKKKNILSTWEEARSIVNNG